MNKGTLGWEDKIKRSEWANLADNLPKKITFTEDTSKEMYSFKGQWFEEYEMEIKGQGYVEEYWSVQRCYSTMINIPGI